jgi:hypothetical protein
MKKFLILTLSIFMLAAFVPLSVQADVPYRSYNYDYWKNVVPSPAPYEPAKSETLKNTEAGALKLPGDMSFDADGNLYIADSGNNRIVVLDKDLNFKRVISEFTNDGKTETFKNPGGITVDGNGNIHVADTDNGRVVSISQNGEAKLVFGMAASSITGANFVFSPLKVGVDSAGRYYVIAKNVFQGMMSFDADGSFFGYFGTIKVQSSFADRFWKLVATQEQKKKMQLFIPTEFTGLDVDKEGFVYATNVDYYGGQTIRRLNPKGSDVLVNYTNKQIVGDIVYRRSGALSGPTKFVDIKARDKGIYSALDYTRGRIFTYDSEGNILYIFGGMGSELGMFKQPVAIESFNDRIYVLDQQRGAVVMFEPTRYGELINQAIGLRYDGAESEAVKLWEEVLKLDAHYELAYSGIGKSLLAAGKNKEAVEYLKKGMNKRYYSVAFKRLRNDFLKENINIVAAIIIIIILIPIAVKTVKFVRERKYRKRW